MPDHRHTVLERQVIAATRELAQAYARLESVEGRDHPSHGRDVADAVHVVQRIVAMRLARRVAPGEWSRA